MKKHNNHAIMLLQSKNEGGKTLTMQKDSEQTKKVLDEIIENAIELPVESQNLLLMMARAMQYTKKCMTEHSTEGQKQEPPKQTA